jgi:hypothetical protein
VPVPLCTYDIATRCVQLCELELDWASLCMVAPEETLCLGLVCLLSLVVLKETSLVEACMRLHSLLLHLECSWVG